MLPSLSLESMPAGPSTSQTPSSEYLSPSDMVQGVQTQAITIPQHVAEYGKGEVWLKNTQEAGVWFSSLNLLAIG